MKTAMNIGTVVDKDSLGAVTEAIVKIMEAGADQRTIRAGLTALSRMSKIDAVTISHCVINGDRSVSIDMQNATVDERPSDDLSSDD
ncbi:hypothetical protein [Rhizorhabdus wittichii]|uniref:hypothetical protein n=1 Tax=Rhizorhabdus wittichii TaxID=160791 RepID=UPI0012FE1E89|nr:hypothetical protein [Rhizorhabdus wittichii]